MVFHRTINSIFSPYVLTLRIMSMKLLHSSIQLSQKVLHAIPLTSSEQNIINALLIFRNYAQRIKIDCNESIPTIFSLAIYPLDVPICHITQFGELIVAVTTDAYIVFFTPDQPFKTITSYQLTDRISPSQIPVAHVLPSINNKFLVCCGFSKNCVVISNIENNFAQIKIELPDFIVLGIAPCATDNIFAFLIMSPLGERLVILADITSQQFSKIQEFIVSEDTYKIISTNSGNDILAFSKTSITSIIKGDKISSSQITTYFFVTPTFLIYQILNGDMFGLNTTNMQIIHMGNIPLSSLLYLLSPTLLLSVSEYSNCEFISLPILNDQINVQFNFDSLPKQVLHLTPRIIASTFNGRSLIFASGNEDESQITQIQNTVNFNRQILTKINLNDENSQNAQLFVTGANSMLLSSMKTVPIIGQSYNYSENQTICIGRLKTNIIQIHKRGINVLLDNGEEKTEQWKHWESPSEITCAAIGEESVFVSFSAENRCIVLDSEFNFLTDKMVGKVISATYLDKGSIAIATKHEGSNHSAISIYSIDLNPGDSEIHLTSQVVNMVFSAATVELYASTQDGFVYKINVNDNDGDAADLEKSVVTIFSEKVAPLIFPFFDSILIFAGRTFIYNDQNLLALAATVYDSPPVSVTAREKEIFVLEKDGTVSLLTVDEMENDLKSSFFLPTGTPRRMANIGEATLTVTKSRQGNQLSSFLSILKRKKLNSELFQNINVRILNDEENAESIENEFAIISILVVPDTSTVIVGCQRKLPIVPVQTNQFNSASSNENRPTEYFLKIFELIKNDDQPTGDPQNNPDFPDFPDFDSFELGPEKVNDGFNGYTPITLQTIPLNDRPNVISYVKGIVLVGTGRHIFPMVRVIRSDGGSEWNFENSGLASIHTQVGFIEVSENYVWVGDKTQSVICFSLIGTNTNNNSGGVGVGAGKCRLAIIACDTEPKQLTAMKVLSKHEIAVADKFGTITVMRLPDDIVANTPWRASQMTERGIFMPQCGHLVKVASLNVGETVTSLARSPFSDALFYTTLLGQIGALVRVLGDEDFACIQAAENATRQQWQKEFPLMKMRRFDHLKVSVVSIDAIEQIGQLSEEGQQAVENVLVANYKRNIQQVVGMLAKYKTLCKF